MNINLEAVAKTELDALGYDLVLLRRGGTRSRPVVEIRIDRRDGQHVSVADCVRASRAIEARFDAGIDGKPVYGGSRYELQVSSPGDARRRAPVDGSGRAPRRDAPQWSAGDEHTDDGSRDGRFG